MPPIPEFISYLPQKVSGPLGFDPFIRIFVNIITHVKYGRTELIE